jgi:hypothetical protein
MGPLLLFPIEITGWSSRETLEIVKRINQLLIQVDKLHIAAEQLSPELREKLMKYEPLGAKRRRVKDAYP